MGTSFLGRHRYRQDRWGAEARLIGRKEREVTAADVAARFAHGGERLATTADNPDLERGVTHSRAAYASTRSLKRSSSVDQRQAIRDIEEAVFAHEAVHDRFDTLRAIHHAVITRVVRQGAVVTE